MRHPALLLLHLVALLSVTPAATRAESALRSRPEVVAPEEAKPFVEQGLTAGQKSGEQWMREAYAAARDAGWWWARFRYRQGRLEMRPGPRARLGELELKGADEDGRALFRDVAGLREGLVLGRSDWRRRLQQGLVALGNEGYPFSSVGLASLDADSTSGRVDVVLALYLERRRKVAKVEVLDADHTRPEVLARLSGIEVGTWYREEDVDEAGERWKTRGLVEEVTGRAVHPASQDPDTEAVEVQLAVRQRPDFGRASAALGVVRDGSGQSRVSGEVEISLHDLFGTAREFEGRWSDDGVQRRRLNLGFLEPRAFGSPFDLHVALATQHEDDLYDRVDFAGDLGLLGRGGRRLELHAQFERSTFAGQSGRLRWRRRLGATLGWHRGRPPGRGFYGGLSSRVDAAQISEKQNVGQTDESVSKTSTQTLVDAHGAAAFAWSHTLAWEFRLHWSSVEGADLPLPRGEQWSLGGARTVRGYREEQFHGERTGYGGAEWVLGPNGAGQAYLFSDVGWIRETVAAPEGESTQLKRHENWLFGFGLGLRTPTRAGALDLSIGFSEQIRLDRGKLHLALTQQF